MGSGFLVRIWVMVAHWLSIPNTRGQGSNAASPKSILGRCRSTVRYSRWNRRQKRKKDKKICQSFRTVFLYVHNIETLKCNSIPKSLWKPSLKKKRRQRGGGDQNGSETFPQYETMKNWWSSLTPAILYSICIIMHC